MKIVLLLSLLCVPNYAYACMNNNHESFAYKNTLIEKHDCAIFGMFSYQCGLVREYYNHKYINPSLNEFEGYE